MTRAQEQNKEKKDMGASYSYGSCNFCSSCDSASKAVKTCRPEKKTRPLISTQHNFKLKSSQQNSSQSLLDQFRNGTIQRRVIYIDIDINWNNPLETIQSAINS